MSNDATKGMSIEEQLAALQAENAALKAKAEAKANVPLTCKVSEKGAVSVYGLGRFPVTLYAQQWERLFGVVDAIKTFIKENERKLARKE